jgi:AcrR family transcriptional regulator
MADDRKEQIYETATQLFARQGYNGASMRDIARALDLRGASLYSHITAKEELLWTILERAADEFLGVLEPIVTDERLRPIEKLRLAVHAHVKTVAGNLDAATVYFHEWKHLPEPRRTAFLARRTQYEQMLREVMAEGVAEGTLAPGVDPKFATLAVLSVVNWLYTWYNPAGALTPDEIAEQFLTLLLQGLLNPAAQLEEVAR